MIDPVEILQHLIRFDTTNPPGKERDCVSYIDQLLNNAGFLTQIFARDPHRTNLITRLKGTGSAPPLLLYGHVDVVTTKKQAWTQPPFEGRIVNGYIWGRGALDMKGGVAMMLAALQRAKSEDLTPAGDVVLAILSDEEDGGDYGAKFLVENHPEQFEGIRYALGEFGGVRMYLGGKTFYPIQVGEKQICWMKARIRGPAGHGSRPMRGGAMAKLSRTLQRLDRRRLPVHITPIVRQMIGTIASSLPAPLSLVFRQLINPRLTDVILGGLGDNGRNLEPLFHNTVNATIVAGGEKVNVIPSEIVLEMDGRLLPGFSPEDMLIELRQLLGREIDLELVQHDPGPPEPDMGLFDTLAAILERADPGSKAIPLLIPAVTDARFFSRLGIQTYGFTPMVLPSEFKFFELVHAADERVPISALEFGTHAIYQAIQEFGS